MDITATWQLILAFVGAMGGLEGVKWLINRKTNTRLAIAEAESAEFHLLQETNTFLQQQLQNKEERFVEQTELLRKTQRDLYEAKEREYEARLELAQKKCEDQNCPFRMPPNAQTPPRPGLTKEQYHAQKTNGQ